MIAPQELRLGNLVTINNPDFHKQMKGIPVVVNGINLTIDKDFPASSASISVTDGMFSYSQFNEFLEPIELSEDWLLKFGFEKKAEHNFKLHVLTRSIIHAYTHGKVEIELGNRTGYSFGYPAVQYVHQLQNLFQSLCGEELKIKEL